MCLDPLKSRERKVFVIQQTIPASNLEQFLPDPDRFKSGLCRFDIKIQFPHL